MQKPFVLVADDNEATCTLVTALLQHDFVVEIAGDGMSAIERLRGRRYAAVILDLLLPLADGYAVLDFLRMERPDLLPRVVVATTTAPGRRDAERIASYGVHSIMPKPFEIHLLHARVKEIAGAEEGFEAGGPFLSTGMILMLADLLR